MKTDDELKKIAVRLAPLIDNGGDDGTGVQMIDLIGDLTKEEVERLARLDQLACLQK